MSAIRLQLGWVIYSWVCETSQKTTDLDSATARAKTHPHDGAAQAFRKLISPFSLARARGFGRQIGSTNQ
jgi:hypothetical protein